MSWNYRLVKYADGDGCGLHRVFYGGDGGPTSMSEEPVSFTGDSPEEVRRALRSALDVIRLPVFNEPPDWVERLQAELGYERDGAARQGVVDFLTKRNAELREEVDRLQAIVDRFERALEISACDIAPCKGCGVPVVYSPPLDPLCVPCDWAKDRNDSLEAEVARKEPDDVSGRQQRRVSLLSLRWGACIEGHG